MRMSYWNDNLKALQVRFPRLAEGVLQSGFGELVCSFQARDGSVAYGIQQNGQIQPVTNPIDPMAKMNAQLNQWSDELRNFSRPVLVLGVHPGLELLHIFNLREKAVGNGLCEQALWICIDSMPAFCGFLKTFDAVALIQSPRVQLFGRDEMPSKVEWLRANPQFPYLFSMISVSPPQIQEAVLSPMIQLIQERSALIKKFQDENEAYYAGISDEQLAEALAGKAGRKPRLMVPTCIWSTVIQYSIRDTVTAFQRAGWETMVLAPEGMMTPFYAMESINRFKPDLFLHVNHLRTESEGVLPHDMMVVSWIQDPLPSVNNFETAKKWNAMAAPRKRDLIVGYTGQLKPYGYLEDRLSPLSMIVDTEIFKPRELTPEQIEKYGCDVCFASNCGLPTDRLVKEILVHVFEEYGVDEATLMDYHDRLWDYYRAEKTITSYQQLIDFLHLDAAPEDQVVQRLFWRLNDVIYRHVVIEWLDDYATQANAELEREEDPQIAQTYTDNASSRLPTPNPQRLKPNPQRSAPFRLHLYGKGWGQHPRFAQYAKGEIAHGEELSIAYQAAKRCLHLNSVEGGHQRILEVCASGSNVISRNSTDRPSISLVLGRLMSCLHENSSDSLDGEDIRFLNDYFWTILLKEIRSSKDGCAKEQLAESLRLKLHDLIGPYSFVDEVQSQFAGRMQLVRQLYGDCESAGKFIPLFKAYCDHVTCKQMNVGVHTLLCSDYDESSFDISNEQLHVVWPDMDALINLAISINDVHTERALGALYDAIRYPGQSQSLQLVPVFSGFVAGVRAKEIFESVNIKHLSDNQLLTYANAAARAGKMELAESVIDIAYRRMPNLKNGYASVAWQRYVPKDLAFEKIIPYFERDIQAECLTLPWRLKYAQALASVGQVDRAVAEVDALYALDPSFKSGYAGIAFQCLLFGDGFEVPIDLYGRDEHLGRLTGQSKIDYANLCARVGRINKAMELVASAYEDDSSCRLGYAGVGRFGYALQGNYAECLALFERSLPYVHSNWLALPAWVKSMQGEWELALDMVTSLYQEDDTAFLQGLSVGLYACQNKIDFGVLKICLDVDLSYGRLDDSLGDYFHALACFHNGDVALAGKLAADVISRCGFIQSRARSLVRMATTLSDVRMDHYFSSFESAVFGR